MLCLNFSGRGPVRERGNPIVAGVARPGSADSLSDIRDSEGKARFGGLLYSRSETRSGRRYSSGERPGLEDYCIPGGKLCPGDDIVPERGPVRRIIIYPEGHSVRRDDIVAEEEPNSEG